MNKHTLKIVLYNKESKHALIFNGTATKAKAHVEACLTMNNQYTWLFSMGEAPYLSEVYQFFIEMKNRYRQTA